MAPGVDAFWAGLVSCPQDLRDEHDRQGRAGFRELRVTDDGKGGRYVETFESMLGAKSQGELAGTDVERKALVDKAGNVLGGMFLKSKDGELVTQITLRNKAAKEYVVEGKNDGAPLKGSFKAAKDLTVEYTRGAALKGRPTPPPLLELVKAGGVYPLLEKEGLIAPRA